MATPKTYGSGLDDSVNSALSGNENLKPGARLTPDFLQASGLYSKEEIAQGRFNGFSRFGRVLDPYGRLTGGREYLFFVKPDLHICVPSGLNVNLNKKSSSYDPDVYAISNGGTTELFEANGLRLNPQLGGKDNGSMFFKDLLVRHPEVAKQLQYGIDGKNPFATLLSFQVNGNLELPNSDFNTLDNPSTMFGTTYEYLYDTEESDEGPQFQLEFVDDKDLDVYTFFKAYSEYHNIRKSGLVTPPSMDYYKYKRLHNTMGIYKIIVGEDAETILHWSYFWGVIPVSVPREAFNDPTWSDGNGISFSVSFKAAWMRDMDPIILTQFNQTMGSMKLESSVKELGVTKQAAIDTSNSYATAVGEFEEGKYKDNTSTIINGQFPVRAAAVYVDKDPKTNTAIKPCYKLKWYA